MKIKLLFLIMLVSGFGYSQKIFEKMAKDMCNCVSKIELNDSIAMGRCGESLVIDYAEELRKYYKVDMISDVDIETVMEKVFILFLKDCSKIKDKIDKELGERNEEIEKDSLLNCDNLRNVELFDVEGDILDENKFDTTYITISEHYYVERMDHGETYSLLSAKWIETCKLEITFIESNNNMKETMSAPGDKYVYEVLKNSEDVVHFKGVIFGRMTYFKLFKLP